MAHRPRAVSQVAGFRPSLMPEEQQRALAEVAATFLGRTNARGAGCLSFGLSGGMLALRGVQMGSFVQEHL